MDEVQTAQLLQVIEGPAPDGGLWNGRKVADWMSELLERPITPQRGWEYLKAMEYSLRIPRPKNKQADLIEQEAWKKKIPHKLQELEQKYPDAKIELWAEDEHRIGLKPIYRKVWLSGEEVPIAKIKWEYQWVWLYGFVHPESGETYWWLLPKVNTKIFTEVLKDFAKHFNLGKKKRILLVLDGAKWHSSKSLEIPEGIPARISPLILSRIAAVPSRLWPLTNEPIVNKSFETIEELENVLIPRLKALMKQPDFISGLTCFHWWPKNDTCVN